MFDIDDAKERHDEEMFDAAFGYHGPDPEPTIDLDREGEMLDAEAAGMFCSICDAIGHGYPGGGPCPLEDSGRWEPEPWGSGF